MRQDKGVIMKTKIIASIIFSGLVLASCKTNETKKEELAKLLKDNPDIITEAIKAHPVAYMEALQSAAKLAQDDMRKKQEDDEKKKLEESFTNPLQYEVRADEAIRGAKNAPITIVEYSDFQCPFCSRAHETVQEIMKKYDGKVRLIYKHLPLSFHDQAMIAAKYYEAIRLQDENKAFKFHDEIFTNQKKLASGEAFLNEIAKKVGADLKRIKKDINSEKIAKRIESDMAEANKHSMQGTPGFLVNGVPVRGAYPTEYFVSLISELEKRGKVKM